MTRKRIDLVMVERGLFESRAKARAAIEAGGVKVDGRTVLKTAEMVDPLAPIDAQPAHGWVGRGALKLAFALEQWPIDVNGRVVLDVGASTGGFTEVCLKAGARRVFAVDVGHGQLHPGLKSDSRVVDLEGVDARALDRDLISEPPSLVVCDASFIGLEKVLPAALALAAPGAQLVALVKPQFQLGPAGVGKGGIVKNEADRLRAVAAVQAFLEQVGWRIPGMLPSPVTGGDGNFEYLLWACKSD